MTRTRFGPNPSERPQRRHEVDMRIARLIVIDSVRDLPRDSTRSTTNWNVQEEATMAFSLIESIATRYLA
ncbi:hypothetical protein ABIF38_000386 [Bradyrhizobium japonicum]|nr:hypothetical protein [Bradyrhizobium elkanii]MCP1737549.1 hypothetical protein [Bradyrhizobium elkanii]MCS3576106.1 hypothetical protein [Bradyrhizobium elkanii]MCS3594559.1 hypothetical protein [Bradyrhizobium elkanii]MCS3626148.1 hypothetical protein [Bradyrhizobium elkanii]